MVYRVIARALHRDKTLKKKTICGVKRLLVATRVHCALNCRRSRVGGDSEVRISGA